MNYQHTQEVFVIVERLGMVCATQGIDEKNKEICNEYINKLLSSIRGSILEVSAQNSGILL